MKQQTRHFLSIRATFLQNNQNKAFFQIAFFCQIWQLKNFFGQIFFQEFENSLKSFFSDPKISFSMKQSLCFNKILSLKKILNEINVGYDCCIVTLNHILNTFLLKEPDWREIFTKTLPPVCTHLSVESSSSYSLVHGRVIL